jgi:hypothetical protein
MECKFCSRESYVLVRTPIISLDSDLAEKLGGVGAGGAIGAGAPPPLLPDILKLLSVGYMDISISFELALEFPSIRFSVLFCSCVCFALLFSR